MFHNKKVLCNTKNICTNFSTRISLKSITLYGTMKNLIQISGISGQDFISGIRNSVRILGTETNSVRPRGKVKKNSAPRPKAAGQNFLDLPKGPDRIRFRAQNPYRIGFCYIFRSKTEINIIKKFRHSWEFYVVAEFHIIKKFRHYINTILCSGRILYHKKIPSLHKI